MARPRVILASSDAEVAVQMMSALNPRRYRVEHVFDLSEALLRAELVLAHGLVIHTQYARESLVRRCSRSNKRLSLVFVSPDDKVRGMAARLAARYLQLPFEVPDFKTAVYHAVHDTKEERKRSRQTGKRSSGVRAVQRVLMFTSDPTHGNVIAAVLRKELGIMCDVVASGAAALAMLEHEVDAVIAEADLLMTDSRGLDIGRALALRGIALIPMQTSKDIDVSIAGQLAWDLVPQVRRSLFAREKASQAG